MSNIKKAFKLIVEKIASAGQVVVFENRVKGVAAIEADDFVIKSQLSTQDNVAVLDFNNTFTAYNEFTLPVIGVPAVENDEFVVKAQLSTKADLVPPLTKTHNKLVIDENGAYYLPFLNNLDSAIDINIVPTLVRVNNLLQASFSLNYDFTPPRLYGFDAATPQIITVYLQKF